MLASLLKVLHFLVTIACIGSACLYFIREFYGPVFQFKPTFGKELYLDACDTTTDKFEDLVVDASLTQEQATKQTEKHGVAFVREILSPSTAQDLRSYILKANHEIEGTFVKDDDNRFHIIPDPTEPPIQAALKEVASHEVFRPLIDGVLGPSSSLVALSVITNLYGAGGQDWHYDTAMSHATHPSYFVPEYTLAIPLQDTTNAMGATQICPGTHVCADLNVNRDMMRAYFDEHVAERILQYDSQGENEEEDDEEEEYDYDGGEEEEEEEYNYVSSDADFDSQQEMLDDFFEWWFERNYPCNITAQVNAGDGMLYNSDLYHRGGPHTDPEEGTERVVIFITFAASRQEPNDKRFLPLGTVHSLHWKRWGHTIDDFLTMDTQPWRIWHIFGLFLPSSSSSSSSCSARPWTMIDYFFMIFQHEFESMHPISDDFDLEYFSGLVDECILSTLAATALYMLLSPLLWMYALRKRNSSAKKQ
eukprot:scaffold6189_cov101-Cylindrotheca_fusiformis.AAC.5